MKGVMVVTGAGGRLGGKLVRFLSNFKHDVQGLTRSKLELSDEKRVMGKITEINPEIIFHTAAMTDVDGCQENPDKAYKDNYLATLNLSLAAARTGARMVYFSTDYVFAGEKSTPYTEEDDPNPLSVYGKTKLEGEKAVGEYLSDYLILRVAWLFGTEGDFCSFVRAKVSRGEAVKLTVDRTGSPGYIPDLIQVFYPLALSNHRGIFHLTNSGSCTRYQMGTEVIKKLGLDAKTEKVTSQELGFAAPRPAYSVLSCRKYEDVGGHRLRTWQEALRDYLENPG